MPLFVPLLLIICLIAFFLIRSLLVVRENERVVIFRLGRFFGISGPGLVVILPGIDRTVRIDLNRRFPGWQGLSGRELNEKIKAEVLYRPGA